ncbi:MAG: hypothetical protein AVO34_06010 [Firmicutes bacterium ML8_F2]|nr:MAG: hypothetical protein AVO34_06010 [Firmicutes bacterium ML8_F2]
MIHQYFELPSGRRTLHGLTAEQNVNCLFARKSMRKRVDSLPYVNGLRDVLRRLSALGAATGSGLEVGGAYGMFLPCCGDRFNSTCRKYAKPESRSVISVTKMKIISIYVRWT